MKFVEGGVNAAKGFEAAGAEAGIKYQNRKDMALVYSTVPAKAAGTFTMNVVKAAPVVWDQQILTKGNLVRAIIVNSGFANAGTGKPGMDLCRTTAEAAAEAFNIPADTVLLASTGEIGKQISPDKVKAGVKELALVKSSSAAAARDAAAAIMTTDTVDKQVAVAVEIGGKKVTVGGMSKGSGMIHPNMCTLLAFVTTDINISGELLKKAVSADVTDTYNMISVDGDTSTNDTLLVLANGMAGNPEITEENEDYRTFLAALNLVNTTLAKKMAGDGEGATALFETKAVNAATKEDARKLAKSVICSSLTKAALFGHDANWGRILCAIGNSGAGFEPEQVDLYFQGAEKRIHIFGNGVACDYSEEEAGQILAEPAVTVILDMHMGSASATAWGCDLSYDYVKINADYRS